MINQEELRDTVTDILVRIEGTINILHKPDIILADRKLQGLKDKVQHLLARLFEEDKTPK